MICSVVEPLPLHPSKGFRDILVLFKPQRPPNLHKRGPLSIFKTFYRGKDFTKKDFAVLELL
jgi:hypothetical protein